MYTTSSIAKGTLRTERSVQNWITKIVTNEDISSVTGTNEEVSSVIESIKTKYKSSNSKCPAEYTLEEAAYIIRVGVGKTAEVIFLANQTNTNSGVTTTDNTSTTKSIDERISRLERIAVSLAETTTKAINHNFTGTTTATAPLALTHSVPAPELNLREKIRGIVSEYCITTGATQEAAFRLLYSYYDISYHTNIRALCKAADIDNKLEYLASVGKLPELLGIAEKYLGGSDDL